MLSRGLQAGRSLLRTGLSRDSSLVKRQLRYVQLFVSCVKVHDADDLCRRSALRNRTLPSPDLVHM